MKIKPKTSRQTFDGEEARRWFCDEGFYFINHKWKMIKFTHCTGNDQSWDHHERFWVTYDPAMSGLLGFVRFALLGQPGEKPVVISFKAKNIERIIFDTYAECLFDANYTIHIALQGGQVTLSYSPPFDFSNGSCLSNLCHQESFEAVI